MKLLTRTTRYVRVTDAGQRYLITARRIITEVDEADEAVAVLNIQPRSLGGYASAKVRTFVDLMVARLRSDLTLN